MQVLRENMTIIENGIQVYTPSLTERLWRALGYRSHRPEMSEDGEKLPFWIMTNTHVNMSILDRIRLLVSGKMIVRTETRTDVPVAITITASSVEIERPGA